MNNPQPWEKISRTYRMSGWVIADCGLDRIYIVIDGENYAVAEDGLESQWVSENYPDELNPLYSGYGYWLISTELPNGPYHLEIIAIDWLGNSVSLWPGGFVIQIDN
jgi:hypothetical protein